MQKVSVGSLTIEKFPDEMKKSLKKQTISGTLCRNSRKWRFTWLITKGRYRQLGHEQVRRGQGEQRASRPRKRRRHFNVLTYLLFVVVTSAILAGVGWLLINDLCAFNKEDVTATIEVTADDSIATIADKLHDAGLIQYKWFFRLFASVADAIATRSAPAPMSWIRIWTIER